MSSDAVSSDAATDDHPGTDSSGSGGQKPTIVVVDDHGLFRQGVIAALGDAVTIVGEADDVRSGIEVVDKTKPDVVLLDVHLTSGTGAEVIAATVTGSPNTRFLALSVSDSPEDVLGLVRAGARGYVTKRIHGSELIQAILDVVAGNAVFSPRLAGFVLDAFTATSGATTAAGHDATSTQAVSTPSSPIDPDVDQLTAREMEVMQHLARGYAYKEIAAELFISVRTVESHASAVLRKLQLSNRHELAHWAMRKRIV